MSATWRFLLVSTLYLMGYAGDKSIVSATWRFLLVWTLDFTPDGLIQGISQ